MSRGTVSGNGIVTDGLVIYLDAANRNSYASGSITWSDLTANRNNGTLTNGPTFSSANGGSIVFDGTNDYVSSFPTQIVGIGSKTIFAFINTTTSSRAGICSTRPSIGSNGWVLTVNRTVLGNLTYYHTGGSLVEATVGMLNNVWYQVCVTYSTTTNTATLYVNGNQVGTPATGFSVANVSSFNGVIGDEDLTTPFKGNIASVQIYNRALSATEVLQNYNSTKTRFGL